MAGLNIREEALSFPSAMDSSAAHSVEKKKRRFFSFKAALFTHDVLLFYLFFGLSAQMSGSLFLMRGNLGETLVFFIISLIGIAFFPVCQLYSYHLIFSKKLHLVNLGKAFVFSLVAVGFIFLAYSWSNLLMTSYFVWGIVFIYGAAMLFRHFFKDQLVNVFISLGISFVVIGLIGLINPEIHPVVLINRQAVFFGFFIGFGVVVLTRFFLVHVVFNIFLRRHFRRQLAIVGTDSEARKIATHIVERNAPFWVAGVLGSCGLELPIYKTCLGTVRDLPDITGKNNIDELIVTDEHIDKRTLISLLDFCMSRGLTIWFTPALMPIIDIKLHIDNFCGIQMIRLYSQKKTGLFGMIKHGLDALITLPVFLILSPLFLLIAAAIRRNSKGPAIYRAKMVGKGSNLFDMYKFRSMTTGNGHDIHKSYVTRLIKGEIDDENNNGEPLKVIDDPRVTPVGRFLRKYSLDELPQLINVIKGDMSLVGPRPCLPYEYAIYKEWHKKRTCVRPGITGLWQVAGRSAVKFEDMVLLDLYYIYNQNLLMDFTILLETLFVVIQKKGAH